MTLGRLVRRLEQLDPALPVRTDDEQVIADVESYRGNYCEPALRPVLFPADRHLRTVGELLEVARAAIGKTVQGFKGGSYVLHADDPLWFAEHGSASGTRPIGVHVIDGEAVIMCCEGL
jgi:hypothetical protein